MAAEAVLVGVRVLGGLGFHGRCRGQRSSRIGGGGGELAMRDGEGGETATEAGVSVCVREAENAMPCFGSVWVGLLVMNTENSGGKILFIYKIYHPGIFFL